MTDTNETTASEMAKKLEPEEVQQLQLLHRSAQEQVQRIGQMEVQKGRLLASLAEMEERAQAIMNAAAARLGIQPGVAWRMAPDGTVVILDQKPTAPPTH